MTGAFLRWARCLSRVEDVVAPDRETGAFTQIHFVPPGWGEEILEGKPYRHYHACLMRTILTGRPDPAHVDMYKACREALMACTDAVKPGSTMGDVFGEHARVLDGAGYREQRFEACGYGLGAVFTPVWVEQPMLHAGNPLIIVPNMVIFLHMILVDDDSKRAMTLGHTVIVTETGCEAVSRSSLDLVVNGV